MVSNTLKNITLLILVFNYMNKIKLLVIASLVFIVGCTDNTSTRVTGGKMTINLDKGQKLVNITWKQNNIWYLTRVARPGESPETYSFKEKSQHGFWEGEVIIIER